MRDGPGGSNAPLRADAQRNHDALLAAAAALFTAVGVDALPRSVDSLGVSAANDHGGAFARQTMRGREAQPVARGANQRDFTLQSQIQSSLP